jgi:type IV secretory pathway VirB10-like protein
MTGAPYVQPTQAPPSPRRRSFGKVLLALLVFGVVVFAAVAWVLKAPATKLRSVHADKAPASEWKAEQVYAPIPPAATKAAEVARAERTDDARWRQQEAFNKMLLELLKQRQKAAAKPAEHPKPVKYAMPLVLENKIDVKQAVSMVPTYLLGAASYLPCAVETAINSDVQGAFVAKVTQTVWDTATGHHALVPQGSKILGNTQSNKLVFGNERLDTVSLKLTLPSGKEVDLGNAPVTDEQGQAGLTGDVNRHLLRIYGAVFITGVLKGGTMAMQQAMAQAGGANQVAVSVAGSGSQVTNRLAGPLIDTRPTIKVASGQTCQVILLEALHLPAVWTTREPATSAVVKTSQSALR